VVPALRSEGRQDALGLAPSTEQGSAPGGSGAPGTSGGGTGPWIEEGAAQKRTARRIVPGYSQAANRSAKAGARAPPEVTRNSLWPNKRARDARHGADEFLAPGLRQG
jgi:hypothetical protein